jgi:hypothetical protein
MKVEVKTNMTIKIDREIFKGRVYSKFSRRMYGDIATGDLSDAIYKSAQEWFNNEEWKINPELDTSKECRIDMRRHIRNKINLDDADKSWCIASNNWKWIADSVIVYIVGLVVDHYWRDIYRELPTKQ